MKFFWTDLQDLFFAKSYYRYSTTFNTSCMQSENVRDCTFSSPRVDTSFITVKVHSADPMQRMRYETGLV